MTDSKLAGALSFWACMGHACGESFLADRYLAAHPEFAWEKPFLRDLPAGRWTLFESDSSSRTSPGGP